LGYLASVEAAILEAMAAGEFRNLRGEGKPLDLERGALAGELWLAHHILENERLLPPWLELGKEIERDLESLAALEAAHSRLADEAAALGAFDSFEARLAASRAGYAVLARATRAKQDKFNVEAPGPLSQRPGIWVERRLEILEERERQARNASASG
jgi:hypothetical protein